MSRNVRIYTIYGYKICIHMSGFMGICPICGFQNVGYIPIYTPYLGKTDTTFRTKPGQNRQKPHLRIYSQNGHIRTNGANAMGHIGHMRIFPVVIYVTRQLYVEMSDFCICCRFVRYYHDIS